MLSKSLVSVLALASAVSASPALRRRADPCEDAYQACLAAGTPKVACQCTNTACIGEDDADAAAYCASATRNLPSITAKPTSCPTTLFDGCNPARSACPDGPGTFTTVSPSTYPTSYVVNGQTVSFTVPPTSCLPLTTAKPTAASACATQLFDGCNPARSSCPSGPGTFITVTPSTYPTSYVVNGQTVSFTVPPTSCLPSASATSSTMATSYKCNPAHSYPAGAVCTAVSGTLQLVTPSPSAGAAKTTPAVPQVSGGNAGAPGSTPKKIDGKFWNINKLSRYCGEGNTGCDYNFDLVANGQTKRCTVIRMPGSNAATESWSNQPCGDFSISWGYVERPAPAFAVITVVDKAGELAWFGVSDVNGQPVTVTPSNPFGSGNYGNLPAAQVFTYN